MSEIKKHIKDGFVAVIFSPGFGSGFHTWGAPIEAVFDPDLVEAILINDTQSVEKIIATKYPDFTYIKGTELDVEWVREGDKFRIDEYDGREEVVWLNMDDYITA